MRTALSAHFYADEFVCKCCKELPYGGMDPKLIQLLEAIRAKASEKLGRDAKMKINSGYRCPRRNEYLRKRDKKVARSSQHMLGTAADIVIRGLSPEEVALIADVILGHSGGIGIYPTFTHVDVRRNEARW